MTKGLPKCTMLGLALLTFLVAASSATAQMPAANLDQVRNGSAASPVSPGDFQNGNLGEQQAHYLEGYSAPYRAVFTNMPLNTPVSLLLGFDIKHSGAHALDYLTHYDRIDLPPEQPHQAAFGHVQEVIDPLDGVTGVSATINTFPIPAPTSVNSPVLNQPTDSFNSLPANEKLFTIFGGTITAATYVDQGDLTVDNSEAQILVTFTVDSETAVLAWGGHIGSRNDWGFDNGVPRSAGGISGSPYHMRLLDWNLNNLGNQDRSLSAAAVFVLCGECIVTGDDGPVCPASIQTFTAPIDGICDQPSYSWSIVGDGAIIGSTTGSSVQVQAGSACGGAYTVTASVGCDGCSTSPITCDKTVVVNDTSPPVLSGQGADETIACTATPVFTPPTATDDCDPNPQITFNDVTTPGACAQEFSVTRTWTTTDACGNSAQVSQTISVEDDTPPVISGVGADATIDCAATPAFSDPTATDDCDTAPSLTFADVTTPGACDQEFSVTRTWTATDDCGNASTASQTISVEDNTAPVISGVGADATIDCAATPAFSDPTATDDCDPTPSLTFADVTTPGACDQEFSVTRTWTATDDCGNASTASQTISVEDDTAPVISGVGADATIDCTATPLFSNPTATDDCDPNPSLTFADVTTPGACDQEFSVTRTWTATDDCGNASTASQTISVEDDTAPVISGVGADETIDCTATPLFSNPTATDDCDPNPSLTFADVTTPGACDQEFSVTRTWTATDDCGNASTASQTISVEDSTAPVISGVGADETIDCTATPLFSNPTATDDCDPNPSLTFADVTTPGACDQEFSVTRTWTATDDCGNASTASQTISVEDSTAPVISGVGADETIDCTATPLFSNPTATDDCDPNPSLTFADVTTPGACDQEFSVTRTWTATDDCGNASTASQTISVEDSTAPVISGVGADETIDCTATPLFSNPTATDDCDPNPSLTFADVTTPGACDQEFSVTRTWTATDDCGNASTASQTISVEDSTAPVISGVGADETIDCTATPLFSNPTATDDCDPNPSLTFADVTTPGACDQEFSVTRTWTATDDCGNASTASQTISVEDSTPPTVECPLDIIVCENTPVTFTVTATDDCDSNPTLVQTAGLASGSVFPVGVTTVSFSATDDCGNGGSCSFTVTVNPNPVCTLTEPSPPPLCGSTGNILSAAAGFVDYQWSVNSTNPGWTIDGGNGTSQITYTAPAAVSEATFTLVVTDGNDCQGTCSVTFSCLPPQVEFCSLTQGFYGNAGGKFNRETAEVLMNRLLTEGGDLTVGLPGQSFTVTAGDGYCLVKKLPANRTPTTLPSGDGVFIPGRGCNTSTSIPTAQGGKWANVFLGQTLSLSLNLRLNMPLMDLGSRELCTTFITQAALPGPDGIFGTEDDVPDPNDPGQTFTISQSVIDALGNLGLPNTVSGLLTLANGALGGATDLGGATIGDINKAVDAINKGFDKCRFLILCDGAPLLLTGSAGNDLTVSTAANYFTSSALGSGSESSESPQAAPARFEMGDVQPNPFNPSASISLALPNATDWTLNVYSATGQLVRRFDGYINGPGFVTVNWDGRNENGESVSTGIYLFRVVAGEFHGTKKAVLLK